MPLDYLNSLLDTRLYSSCRSPLCYACADLRLLLVCALLAAAQELKDRGEQLLQLSAADIAAPGGGSWLSGWRPTAALAGGCSMTRQLLVRALQAAAGWSRCSWICILQ
jgi:hypothetical protein